MANTRLVERFKKSIVRMFPSGKFWESLLIDNAILRSIVNVYAKELCLIEERAIKLLNELDPRITSELLLDWERLLGLPDECDSDIDRTTQQRRDRIVQVLTTLGGQNEQFFKDLLANFGFNADVISAEDQPQFRAGLAKAGDRLTNGDWRYAFVVRTPASFLVRFRAGRSTAGERLLNVGNNTVECLVEKYKPAHTIAIYSFGDTDL